MKCNIVGIDNELKYAMELTSDYLKAELDDNGVEIEISKGDKIEVIFNGDKVKITYPSISGFLRALMLCSMEIEQGTYNNIEEKIYFRDCGSMPDFSRNGVMRVDALKDYIAQMAVMGLNQIYLYMEDTYTVDDCPYLGYMRGRYTASELKEIDDFAYAVGIEAIPHIQVLGHMSQYIKWDEGMKYRDTAAVLLAGDAGTYEFIEKAIKAVSACFRTKKIHLGCDEAGNLGSGAYYSKNGYRDRKEIMIDHIAEVGKICDKYGLIPIIYGDTIFSVLQGGQYASDVSNQVIPQDYIDKIPKNLQVVYWEYEKDNEDYYDAHLKAYKKISDTVIFWGGIWTWFGFMPNNKMTWANTNPALLACKKNGVQSAIASIWGNDGTECDYRMTALGLQMFAEHMYNAEVDEELLAKRFEYFTDGSYDMFMSFSDFHDDFEGKVYPRYFDAYFGKRYVWSDILVGLMDKDLEINPMSAHYKKLSALPSKYDNKRWNEDYEYFGLLCDYLALKCEISEKLVPAYKSGDRETLAEISEVMLPALSEKIKKVRDAYRKIWYNVYKPFGFEVLDVRFGGVSNRIDTAIMRLSQYLNGEVDIIEELEEVRLPHRIEWYQNHHTAIHTACFNN